MTGRFFGAVVSEARRHRLLSEEHFSVDGTLLEAWASLKGVRPRDEEGNPPAGAGRAEPVEGLPGRAAFQRDPCIDNGPGGAVGAQRQGQAAKLSFAGHVLMENRNGLVVDVVLSQATGRLKRKRR